MTVDILLLKMTGHINKYLRLTIILSLFYNKFRDNHLYSIGVYIFYDLVALPLSPTERKYNV